MGCCFRSDGEKSSQRFEDTEREAMCELGKREFQTEGQGSTSNRGKRWGQRGLLVQRP